MIEEMLGIQAFYHCKDGAHIVAMVDGERGINGAYEEAPDALRPLTKEQVQGKDLIVLFGGYNNILYGGYSEFPPNSGRSYEKTAEVQKAVAQRNGLPCCDLFHTSGINPHTWCVFCADAASLNEEYTPYRLDEKGNVLSSEYLQYQHMESYYQLRDGKVVLEQYTGYAPYPYNNDQLHKSAAGYRRIAEVVAGAMIDAYGI